MTPLYRWAPALLASLVLVGACRADDAFPDLLKRVPSQANAVLFLDVTAVYASPLAQREKWGQPGDMHYVGGLYHFPRTASKLVAASQFSPGSLENEWEVGLMQVP